MLFCNGKLLQGDDYQTLRQARVCSGSKILARRGEICSEREAELKSRLRKVEEEGERLGQEVARLAAASPCQEVTVQRKENKMVGEQLMRLLETLDGISLGQDMFELRARRKKAAARINSLMDTNDSNIQVTTQKCRGKVMSHGANKLHLPYLTISIYCSCPISGKLINCIENPINS